MGIFSNKILLQNRTRQIIISIEVELMLIPVETVHKAVRDLESHGDVTQIMFEDRYRCSLYSSDSLEHYDVIFDTPQAAIMFIMKWS